MPKRSAKLEVRTTRDESQGYGSAAESFGVTKSEWARRVLDHAARSAKPMAITNTHTLEMREVTPQEIEFIRMLGGAYDEICDRLLSEGYAALDIHQMLLAISMQAMINEAGETAIVTAYFDAVRDMLGIYEAFEKAE